MSEYPTSATPLPWSAITHGRLYGAQGQPVAIVHYVTDAAYIVRAANAFPHLVAVLEALLGDIQNAELAANAEHALAIARGEMTP